MSANKMDLVPASELRIDWFTIYRKLGLYDELLELNQSLGGVGGTYAGKWNIPIVRGLSFDCIRRAYLDNGIQLCGYTTEETADQAGYKIGYSIDVKSEYCVGWEHYGSPESFLNNPCFKGISILEGLMLGLGVYIETGGFLDYDGGSITMCVESSVEDESGAVQVPGFFPEPESKKIIVTAYAAGYTSDDYSLRPRRSFNYRCV